MSKDIEITGDPKTGRWKAKYKGKTHRYPKTARPKKGEEVPQAVLDWAATVFVDQELGKRFR